MARRILLVEDSVMISSAYKMLLEANGYDVEVAATAADAISTGATEPHDLMLLDLTLPDADGLTVISGLASRGLRPRSIFALTGHSDAGTRQRCSAAGCDEVIVKPMPLQELLGLVAARMS
ncbi:MAG: response regulator transcription factor [Gemmatimonadaceae bacterium]|nr:response regulator transcription factor [Gemmatimonadaceae bacterium]